MPCRITYLGGPPAIIEAAGLRLLTDPVFEGWSHFREGREAAERAFATAGLDDRVVWAPAGQPVDVDV